jgi:polyisoprenoid-binding protein YceI
MRKLQTLSTVLICALSATVSRGANLVVDKKQSQITVSASATGGGFKGSLKDFEASISGDASTLKPDSAKITWKFVDLDTEKEKRNEKMLSWLDIGKHPSGSFVLKRTFEKDVLGKKQTYALGSITIHGVAKQLVFPITTVRNGNALTISGKAALDYTDFDLPIIRMALVATVNPKLTVDFQLTGTIE